MATYCDVNTDKAVITITSPIKQIIQTKGIVDIEVETVTKFDTNTGQDYQVTVQFNSVQRGVFYQTYLLPGEIGQITREINNTFVFITANNPPQQYQLQGNANAPENFISAVATEIKEHPSNTPAKKKYQHRLVIKRGDNGDHIHGTTYFDSIPTYTVGCEGCPPGHIKCATDDFPGYCCTPCTPIESRIDSMVRHLKEVNNG